MQRFVFCLFILAFFSCGVMAQEETQIGVRVIGANASLSPNVKHRSFGLGADTIVNLGEHVSVHGVAQVLRLKLNCPEVTARHYEGDGDIRVAPFSMAGFHFFGAAGANLQRLTTPFGSQSFLSPTLGGGAGFGRYGDVTYKHGFPDIVSPAAVRYDEIGLNGYIPMSKTSKWRGRFGGSYRRSQFQNSNTEFSLFQVYLGVSRIIGEK
jgi:hypothetical protein